MSLQYHEQMEAAQARLRAVLAPQTEEEQRTVNWLCHWEPHVLNALCDMAERRQRRTAEQAAD
jgi:hypothetical protein